MLLLCGCAAEKPAPASLRQQLAPGVTYSADLDRDGAPELVVLDHSGGSLTITDGTVIYHSREKWRVVSASLGDVDGDGFPEVITLLDDQEGRHIGLFAYFGGQYRERLVTSELTPRPISLTVVEGPGGHDALAVDVEPPPGENAPAHALFRWNGFGFTILPE
jgi:hypothetical protein